MSTPITIGGVACYELWREGHPESGRESIARDKISAVRVLRCAWTNRLVLSRALLGGSTVIAGVITYAAPLGYPEIPVALAERIDIAGIGVAGQAGADSQISYTDAELTVHYETPDFDVLDNPNGNGQLLLEESMDYSAEFVTIPTASLVWTSDGQKLPPDAVPGKIMGMGEYTIVAHRHPNPPFTTIDSLVGKVNNGVFSPLGRRSFADGHLLFLGSHDTRQFILDPLGNLTVTAYTVTYKWAFRTQRWNTAFRPDTGQFEDFQTPAGNQIYQGGNMSAVF
jgi:hypothetical protein